MKLTEIQNNDAVEVVKAAVKQAYEKLKKPVTKSDSGISINALNGFPGPYSNYVEKTIGIEGLTKLTKDLKGKTAKIYSVVCFFDGKTLLEFVEKLKEKNRCKKRKARILL